MITRSDGRRSETGAAVPGVDSAGAAACPCGCVPAARTVTPEQVDLAVAQLRERPGRSAVEQIQSVLRAFDLTIVPTRLVPDPR